jgi:beta-lactamase regulating signal transducer with metallopeptidase domain
MINTIIPSSVLILIILAIRFVFRGKINPLLQYGLWSLVALRLVAFSWLNMIPIESALSVMNVASNATEIIRGNSAVEKVITGNVEAGPIENATLVIDNARTGVMTSGEGISAIAAVDWQLAIMVVWAIGIIFLGLWFTFVNHKFRKMLFKKRAFLMYVDADRKKHLDFKKDLRSRETTDRKSKCLPVYVVEGLNSPCLMGYGGNEAIYVTSEVASDQEKLRYAVAHELCHYIHHDLIWSVIRCGLLVFHWFNPLVWVAAVMSKRDCELACDYGVIKRIDEDDRLAYGKTLVDLISQRGQKNNILQMATTMYCSKNGIKERVSMIVKNNKKKTSMSIIVLLIAILSIGCTFTVAPNNTNDVSTEQKAKISDFAAKWANAYSDRDAKTIYELCENEELYFTIGQVAENGQLWMGLSSPWPWNKDYVISIVDTSTFEVYYYFRTSDPRVYTIKETVAIKEINGEYKAIGESVKGFDMIESKASFDETYKYGFFDFTKFAAAYQSQADDANHNKDRKEILENPVTAAIDQLNLTGAKVSGTYVDPYEKRAVVKLKWADGEVEINLIQPMLTDENGAKRQATIWIVVDDPSMSKLITGYMVIEDNLLHLDEVEIITLEDKERIEELGLKQNSDMPNGYSIYNADQEKQTFEITNETAYTFVDYNLLFVKNADGNRLYTTTKKEEFILHLNKSYSDSPPAHPFFVEVKDGKVISVTEKFEFTI